MATVSIKKGYLEILNTLGSADTIVENALRKYLIDKCVERIEKSKRKIVGLEKKYDSSYAGFIETISNEERLKGVEKISQDWEGDMTEWEYWEKELEEWKMRLEGHCLKI